MKGISYETQTFYHHHPTNQYLEAYYAQYEPHPFREDLANALLVYHLNNRTGQCNPTIATLADELGYHRASIYKAIQRLQSHIGMQWIDGKFIFNLAEQVGADDHDDRASLEKKVVAGCGNGFGGSST